MKAIELIDDKAICPVCHQPTVPLTIHSYGEVPGTSESSGWCVSTKSVTLSTNEEHRSDSVEGRLVLCKNCNEVYLAYMNVDTRTCVDCNKYDAASGICGWDKCNKHPYEHCLFIDRELPKKEPYSICALCHYFDANDKWSNCDHRHSCVMTEEQKVDPEFSCALFDLSLFNYKRYRAKVEASSELFDNSIHVEKFDKIIEEQNQPIKATMLMSYDLFKTVPVEVKVTWHSMRYSHLVTLAIDGEVFFDTVIDIDGDSNTFTIRDREEEVSKLIKVGGHFRDQVRTALYKHLESKGIPFDEAKEWLERYANDHYPEGEEK